MIINAYAKINLGLDVLRRRADGYHEVRMIMQSIGVHDELTVEKTQDASVKISTDREDLPVGEDNLIYRAAKLMMDEYHLPGGIRAVLKKSIPVAAGLAGGSADAAATLKAVNALYELGLEDSELMKLGVRIGADVPYCILNGTALSEGIGEILTPLDPCPDCGVLLAKPPISVSTGYVYSNLIPDGIVHPDIDAIISGIEKGDIYEIARNMGNVLETVTIPANPVIADIKKVMSDNGSIGCLMSGSGPTVFGLFGSDGSMQKAYDAILATGFSGELFKTEFYRKGQV
ncbi:MAG: 4-(cytidine 5'-diphospho)-2-C-methyl-D-erythritol kinase [Lachnospiraceae bacterium]|nr:4-(cytidine 5'-diphospho)-2-C-methyl-D-erythritol kinase [Lachnospiraceae bacterium]